MQISTDAADRREYFRINDQVALKYRVIEYSEIDGAIARRQEGFADVNAMASSFASTNLEMKHAIEKCRRDLPDVATFLDGLNGKLDLLIRLLVASGSELPDHPTHDVNLSASGVSFKVTREIPEDSLLEIKLLFFPSFLHIMIFGHVVRCRANDEVEGFPFELAVEFSHLEESDRELLIRHILQKESAMLREARSEPISGV